MHSEPIPAAAGAASPPPSKRARRQTVLTCFLLALLAFPYLWPHSLRSALPGFDPALVSRCEISYFSSAEVDAPHFGSRTLTLSPDSPEFTQLIELLESTRYRLQLSNLFVGGSLNSYSITLDPSASLLLHQGPEVYEISLYGRDIPMGTQGQKKDYSAYGGKKFQASVVAFLAEHGAPAP